MSEAEGHPPAVAAHLEAGEGLLKQRHVEVLAGLNNGHTNKVIARHLDLTEATIKLYVRQLMKIFDAKNRTHLALKAAGHPQVEALISPDAPTPPPATVATPPADVPIDSAPEEPERRRADTRDIDPCREGRSQPLN